MSMAGRAGAVQLPLGQLALIGAGFFAVTNPDKFLVALHRGTQAFLLPSPSDASSASNQPIVIHQTVPVAGSSSSKMTTVVHLVLGAGCCWGSYVLLVQMLPDSLKGMLPVSTTIFNRAVSSLGKAVINLKETLMEQLSCLTKKQDELGEQQEETHSEVLQVKDSVSGLKDDLSLIQESLNLCHSTLSESDRRTAYIAHGVQLLTRGVSTFLPEDDKLVNELTRFHSAGEEFQNPAQLAQLRKLLRSLQTTKMATTDSPSTTFSQAVLLTPSPPSNPESQVPETPESAVDRSVVEVRALLDSLQCGTAVM